MRTDKEKQRATDCVRGRVVVGKRRLAYRDLRGCCRVSVSTVDV